MQGSGGGNGVNKKMSIMSKHDVTFRAMSESRVALTTVLSSLSIPGGQNTHVGSATAVVPVAMDPRVTIKDHQAKLMNAAEVATVKLQGRRKDEMSPQELKTSPIRTGHHLIGDLGHPMHIYL